MSLYMISEHHRQCTDSQRHLIVGSAVDNLQGKYDAMEVAIQPNPIPQTGSS